jgi:xanthine dehydrogenase YagS FAD-binding subunit
MNSFSLADCSTVEAALSQLKEGAVIKAGGVDLLDRMKNGTDSPARLVNIRNISALRGIHATPEGLTIGANTTLAEVAADQTIRSQYTVLADACGSAATPHIRNMATIGGNLLQGLQCFRRVPVPAQGQGYVLCLLRPEPVPRHHGLWRLSFGRAFFSGGGPAGS